MRNAIILALALGAPALMACGGAARAASGGCALSAQDSAYLTGGPVFRECGVSEPARLLSPNVPIDFRPSTHTLPRQGAVCYFAELEFVVDTRGTPETATARVLQSNLPAFANAVIASLPAWRFQAARKDGEAVRQIVRQRRSIALAVTVAPAGSGARTPPSPPRCR